MSDFWQKMSFSTKLLISAFLFSTAGFVYVTAAPPGSPYNLGETLAPTCSPGDANCTVNTPIQQGTNSDASVDLRSTAASNARPFISGPLITSFTTLAQTSYFNLAANIFTTLNEPSGIGEIPVLGYGQSNVAGTSVNGLYGVAESNHAAGTQAYVYAIEGDAYNTSTGTVTNLHGLTGFAGNNSTGTVTHQAGLYIYSGANSGTVTNNYGIRIDNQSGIGTTNYAIHYDGPSASDFVVTAGGNVGIGIVQPESNLHLWGNGTNGSNAELRFGDNGNILLRENTAGDSDQLSIYADEGIIFTTNDEYVSVNPATNGDEEFVVADAGSSDTAIIIENTNSGSDYIFEIHVEDSNEFVIYQGINEDSGNSVLMYNGATQHWGFGTDPTANELQMDSGAHITAGGVFTDASSREYKTGIESISFEEAKLALENLNPVRFQYKEQLGEEYLGFIAEDVPDLVATADRKGLSSMDIVAVLVKVNQEQQDRISNLEAEMEDLKRILNQ